MPKQIAPKYKGQEEIFLDDYHIVKEIASHTEHADAAGIKQDSQMPDNRKFQELFNN